MQLNTIDEKSETDSHGFPSSRFKKTGMNSPNKNRLNKIGSQPKINLNLNKNEDQLIKDNLNNIQSYQTKKFNYSSNNDHSRNKYNASNSTNYTSLPHISNLKSISKCIQKERVIDNCFKTQINSSPKKIKNSLLERYHDMEQLKTDLEILKGKKIQIKDDDQNEEQEDNEDKIVVKITNKDLDLVKNNNDFPTLDEKIKTIRVNNQIKSEYKYTKIFKSIEEREKSIQEKKRVMNKIAEEKKEQNKMIAFKKKIRSKVSKLVNSSSYFICSTFTQQLDDVNNKIKFTETRIKNKKEEVLKNKLLFPRSETPNYLYNINEIMREHSNPTELFKENLSKREVKFIQNDPKYYVQDERYLNSVNFLNKNKMLIDRFSNEDKIINKFKKIPKYSDNIKDLGLIFNSSIIYSEVESYSAENDMEGVKKVHSSKRNESMKYRTHKKIKLKKKKLVKKNHSSPQLTQEIKTYLKDLKFNDTKMMDIIWKNSKKDSLSKIINRNNEFTSKLASIQKKKYFNYKDSKINLENINNLERMKNDIKESLLDIHLKSIKKKK